MDFLEKDLEDIIFNADKEKLSEKGLYIQGKLLRQLKIGNYGICDILEYQRPYLSPSDGILKKGLITIYELKQKEINSLSFMQALRYMQGIKSYLEKKGISENYNYEIVLIGKYIAKCDDFVYLTNFLNEHIENNFDSISLLKLVLFTYNYGLNGIEFNMSHGYTLSNEGF